MNTDSKQWYAAPPTPTSWDSMRTAIVGDTCYFMGGRTGASYGTATIKVYSVSLPALICLPNYKGKGEQHKMWKEIPGYTLHSTLHQSVLACTVGDMDKRLQFSSTNLILGSG